MSDKNNVHSIKLYGVTSSIFTPHCTFDLNLSVMVLIYKKQDKWHQLSGDTTTFDSSGVKYVEQLLVALRKRFTEFPGGDTDKILHHSSVINLKIFPKTNEEAKGENKLYTVSWCQFIMSMGTDGVVYLEKN